MAIQNVNTVITPKHTMTSFLANRKEISYGYIDLKKHVNPKELPQEASAKDILLAGVGALGGTAATMMFFMKKQKIKNPFKIDYGVKQMLSMAAAANLGGILVSSIGESKSNQKKKWKEGAFQMMLTSAPMLLIEGAIRLCKRFKSLNNNVAKIVASCAGVFIGSNAALEVSNRLRSGKDAKKPKRELKPIDMLANLDDAVAVLVLAKVPFADKLHVERALPFIYSFCGFRSGMGDKK